LTKYREQDMISPMKTYIEKYYKELIEGDRFYSTEEDCGYDLVEKVKTDIGWEWADGESCLIHQIDPDTIVWAEVEAWGWGEYLIRICTAILVMLFIAFFCYAVWKG
jgi:hypothetical protein